MLAKSTPLQDIGNVGIPDHVLLKPGKLTPEEWESMKIHAKLGSDAIEQAEANAEKPVKDRKSNRLSRSMADAG